MFTCVGSLLKHVLRVSVCLSFYFFLHIGCYLLFRICIVLTAVAFLCTYPDNSSVMVWFIRITVIFEMVPGTHSDISVEPMTKVMSRMAIKRGCGDRTEINTERAIMSALKDR